MIRARSLRWVGLACALIGCAAEPDPRAGVQRLDYDAIEASLPERQPNGRTSDRIPDIVVTNQHGERLRFFEDIVKGAEQALSVGASLV